VYRAVLIYSNLFSFRPGAHSLCRPAPKIYTLLDGARGLLCQARTEIQVVDLDLLPYDSVGFRVARDCQHDTIQTYHYLWIPITHTYVFV
jgi:hypothetical protein